MKGPRTRWPLFFVGGLAACSAAITTLGLSNAVDEIKFSHARHGRAKVECLACHESIYDAQTLTGSFLPPEAKCLECHKKEKASNNCQFCHTDVKLAQHWPTRKPNLKFGHQKHIELVKEDCSKCHFQLKEPGLDVRISGGHPACQQCHTPHGEQFQQTKCDSCHQDLKRYGLKPVTELSHQGDFLRNHALPARAAGQSCASCHEQNFCLDCHAKTAMAPLNVILPDRPDRDFIHRNDFFSRHPIEAAADPASCKQCHANKTCEQCHAANNVGAAAANPRNPHPPGWALPGSGQFHGDAARRDINNCASCHDQGAQSNCVTCHKVGGIGGDPHPPSFGRKHSLSEAHSNSMCLICHR
jgi:hypothetical protein